MKTKGKYDPLYFAYRMHQRKVSLEKFMKEKGITKEEPSPYHFRCEVLVRYLIFKSDDEKNFKKTYKKIWKALWEHYSHYYPVYVFLKEMKKWGDAILENYKNREKAKMMYKMAAKGANQLLSKSLEEEDREKVLELLEKIGERAFDINDIDTFLLAWKSKEVRERLTNTQKLIYKIIKEHEKKLKKFTK